MKSFRKSASLAIFAGVAAFGTVLGVATGVAEMESALITVTLGQEATKIVETNTNSSEETKRFKSDYRLNNSLKKAEIAFSKEVQDEGSVLLQNGKSTLPLGKAGKVTLFGVGSKDGNFLLGGGGSGSIDTSDTPNLKKAFEDAKFSVNGAMWDFYNSGKGSNYKPNSSAGTIAEAPVSDFSSEEISSVASYKDAGIVVITRGGNEGADMATASTDDPSRSYLEFSQNEEDLIAFSLSHCDKTIVLLNTMNPMELGSLKDKDLAILWIGAGGQHGIEEIPNILVGTSAYPSGKTVDTYAYDSFSSPAMQNFGNFSFTNVTDATASKYLSYQEGIYVGYKYYETRYADFVTGRANVGTFDYSSQVLYPFGYGLSYTSFEYTNMKFEEKAGYFEFSVTVKNTGENIGKEAVEIYMQSPYTDFDVANGIEKSAVQLVGIGKTKALPSGTSDTVTITVPKEEMRAYDAKSNKTYVVDEGKYFFTAAASSHEAINNILAKQSSESGYNVDANKMDGKGNAAMVASFTQNEFDSTTYSLGENGEKITNQFDDVDYATYDRTYKYLTRSNWTGTWPTPLGGESRSMEAVSALIEGSAIKRETIENATMPKTGAEKKLSLVSLYGVDKNSEYWDTLLDQMSAEEMMDLVAIGGYQTKEVTSIAKPGTLDKDGPAGISSTLVGGAGCFGYGVESLLASTWNKELAERQGDFVGEDGIHARVSGWYAPAMNIHRTPFSGRNFEYYSEDSYLSGLMGYKVTGAAQKKGLYCYIKHFALNDQETNRGSAMTFANEQTIREIYLRPFEDAVRKGNATALMVAMNRIGSKWVGAHKGIMTNVLRSEWGFKGFAITDSATAYSTKLDTWMGLQAGTDMWLCAADGAFEIEGYASNPTVMTMLRKACHNILYTIANSNRMNGLSSTSQVVSVTPPWKIALIVVDVILYAGMAALVVITALGMVKHRNEEDSEEIKALQDTKVSKKDSLSFASLGLTFVGTILGLVAELGFSKATKVGVNLNISPLSFVGIGLAAAGLILGIVSKVIMRKTKSNKLLSTLAIWAGAVALLALITALVLVMVLPLFNPVNG